ncbi:MAG: hypothetical protein GX387_07420 [Clostridium sp.]|jgi:hypothetical protein|nr:hypothetical protein [Clostridium sp.]
MREKDILDEYPYILKSLKKLKCKLDEMMKDKELLESVLNHSKEENIHKYTEPTLKVFETVLDRYINDILYMKGKINNLEELKNKINEKKGWK